MWKWWWLLSNYQDNTMWVLLHKLLFTLAVNSASWGQKNYKPRYMCDNTNWLPISPIISNIQKCKFSLLWGWRTIGKTRSNAFTNLKQWKASWRNYKGLQIILSNSLVSGWSYSLIRPQLSRPFTHFFFPYVCDSRQQVCRVLDNFVSWKMMSC